MLGEESGVLASLPNLGRFEKGKNYFLPRVENVRSNRSNGTDRPSRALRREGDGQYADVSNKNISRDVDDGRGRKNSTASCGAALFT